jgi:hypothetical protein
MLPETLPTPTETKPRLRPPTAVAPHASLASRHEAITRELTSYTKYKRWAESKRQGWPAVESED